MRECKSRLETMALCLGLSFAVLSCGTKVTEYDALYLAISSEASPNPIVSLDVALHNVPGAEVLKLPAKPGDADYAFALPDKFSIVKTAYVLRIKHDTASGPAQQVQLRIRGFDDGKKVQATYSGVVDTRKKGQIAVLLKAIDVNCDADGDGTRDCTKQGCCDKSGLEASDCNDDPTIDPNTKQPKGASASPFSFEDPCTQCGNGIDEDCDGTDTPCVDSDKDGVPDCQETNCGAGAATDPSVHPGAVEICDNKDNDCNGQTDEGLPYVGLDGASASGKKGDPCGVGVCAGGTIECTPVGVGGTSVSLRCSSVDKKQKAEDCTNQLDDDCDGQINNGCALTDIDGDGVENDKEKAACAFKYAQYHAEYHPGAPEKCCLPGKTADVCDTNCDGKTTPCDATDKDGDGSPASLDCDDNDPMRYPGAPEKCGDGKVQGCFGADPPCASVVDKDGDGWSPPADCNDNDKNINPEATEVCNGVDDNCNGIVDDGNPEGLDAVCGNTKGECAKQSGIQVCKHFPTAQKPTDPLDCLGKAYNADNSTCVGCDGDQRPKKDLCNYLDDNCNGQSDEDYTYTQQPDGTVLAVNAVCDGVGACGIGKVECNMGIDKAVCSTDPNGSAPGNKAEVCDNQDNDCNGKTDESLTTVADSSCQKVGVCALAQGAIKTVCIAGQWLCDYTAVPDIEFSSSETCTPGTANCQCDNLGQTCHKMVEKTCDSKDNDCDGKTDDDFTFDDLGTPRTVGIGCGTGACAGGTVVCTADKTGLTCDSLPKITKEVCDAKDNDCNGKTDDGMTVAESNCKLVGVCTTDNVQATCPAGKWVCKYDAVANYEAPTETTCDALDNDCDGQTDEDFSFLDLGVAKAKFDACGTGACKAGTVVCTGDQTGLTCSTLGNLSPELCNYLDDNCNGVTDEDFSYNQEGGAVLGVGKTCDGIGMCGGGVVECATAKIATCSTDPNGSVYGGAPEQCNDLDDNCNSATDEGCDTDKDGYCDAAMTTIGKPKSCPGGGGDCQKDNPDVHPNAIELCDNVDNNCSGTTDEIFFYKEPGSDVGIGVGQPCGLGACTNGKVVCDQTDTTQKSATCTTFGKQSPEICNGIDDNCNGTTDEGCDDDKDGYCDANIAWTSGAAVTCAKTVSNDTRDCDDTNWGVNPGITEACNNVDDNCKNGTDEGCDDDKDGYCDAGMVTANPPPSVCPKGPGDCDDMAPAVHPGATEICNDIDDNCAAGTDEGCDDDGDKYCDGKMVIVGTPKVCPKTLGPSTVDCNDDNQFVNPGATEVCDDGDNNCSGTTDEGCDDDGDKYCDAAMVVIGNPNVCPKTMGSSGLDCNDTNPAVNPGATEKCNNIDDNCKTGVDEGCDDDGDLYCDAGMIAVGTVTVCPKSPPNTADDCDDTAAAVHPGALEICDNIDNNCAGSPAIDEGCDDDGDKYCDAAMTIVGVPNVCPKTLNAQLKDCNDTNAQINPGMAELCSTAGVDDNCNGQTDEPGATGCSTFYKDADADGFGAGSSFCLCGADPGNKLTATNNTDCNDGNAAINPGVPKDLCATPGVDDNCDGKTDLEDSAGCSSFYLDNDQDGYGVAPAHCLCGATGKITATNATDCLDSNAAVNPGVAKDTCATPGIDDNCDGVTDAQDSLSCVVYYMDGDGDTFGKLSDNKCMCAASGNYKVTGVTAGNADCDDTKAAVHPGAAEICDNIDNNCTAGADEGCDDDKDGYCDVTIPKLAIAVTLCPNTAAAALIGDDCDDTNSAVHPGVTEVCDNIDNNCAGTPLVDEGCDDDNDNYCDTGMAKAPIQVSTCTATPAGATQGDDCDDTKAAIHPDATEVCDNIDNNCAAGTDEGCDDDNDDYCDAGMAKTAVQVTTCTKTATIALVGDDCDDTKVDIHPGAAEICDNIDNNCAGSPAIDEGCDDDNDNYCDSGIAKLGGVLVTTCTATAANATAGDDCNDAVATTHPGASEICDNVDQNCDGTTDEGCDNDKDGYCGVGMTKVAGITITACPGTAMAGTVGDDCNDGNAAIHPFATEFCDNIDNNCSAGTDEGCDDDNDDYCDANMAKVAGVTVTACPLTAAAAILGDDCDDTKAAVHPGVSEICDNIDNNCQGSVDEGCDDDKDGYCDANMTKTAVTITACNKTAAAAVVGDDCDDAVAAVHPGATEICDNIDNNCAGSPAIDEGCDDDNDDYCDATMGKAAISVTTCTKTAAAAVVGDDCNDAVAAVHPSATEICDNIDNNCVTGTDEGCDDDNDDYCDKNMVKTAVQVTTCKSTATGALVGDDCDDAVASVHPGAAEVCDNIDQNCDGTLDDGCDSDTDGYCDSAMTKAAGVTVTACSSTPSAAIVGDDCNDANAAVHPNATEICDNVDNNCATGTDEGCDDDNDNYCDKNMTKAAGVSVTTCTATATAATVGDDCNDAVASIHPGAAEVCDNIDQNCDATVDEGCDSDTDGYCDSTMAKAAGVTVTACSSTPIGAAVGDDCNDGNAAIHPGVTEICDNLDNNCVTGTDEGCDDDNDNYCDKNMTKAAGVSVTTCTSTATGATVGDDCDDAVAAVHPGATEICDNIDNNCVNSTDEGCDDDNDDFCDSGMAKAAGVTVTTCGSTAPAKTVGDDCNDNSGFIFPGAPEYCDNIDQNCDTVVDDGCDDDNDDYCDSTMFVVGALGSVTTCTKTPGSLDGSLSVLGNDCNDTCSTCYPGGKEVCDGKDNDCSGVFDDHMTLADTTCLKVGVCTAASYACDGAPGTWTCQYGAIPGFQAGTETLCDGLDNNCDGTTDFEFTYLDGATFKHVGTACSTGPCADTVVCNGGHTAAVCPKTSLAVSEVCTNLVDDNCNGVTDETPCSP